MTIGKKTGGRIKGTLNKKTEAVKELLDSMDCDPIIGMAEIAQKAVETQEYELAGRMYKELAQYVAPKLKSQELVVPVQDEVVKKIDIEFV